MAYAETFWWLVGLVILLAALFFAVLALRLARRRRLERRADEISRDAAAPE